MTLFDVYWAIIKRFERGRLCGVFLTFFSIRACFISNSEGRLWSLIRVYK